MQAAMDQVVDLHQDGGRNQELLLSRFDQAPAGGVFVVAPVERRVQQARVQVSSDGVARLVGNGDNGSGDQAREGPGAWREEQRREDELGVPVRAPERRDRSLPRARVGVPRAGRQRRFRRAALGYRCGITGREAREYLRVAEALQELPATRAAFSRGEVTFTKVRALTRVATASCEERLLELAGALTASQLERALRVYRRIAAEDARGDARARVRRLPLRGGRLALPARPPCRRGWDAPRQGVGCGAGASGRAPP